MLVSLWLKFPASHEWLKRQCALLECVTEISKNNIELQFPRDDQKLELAT